MRVTEVDSWAVRGTSALHRAAPSAKVAAFILVLASVVVSQNLFVILGVMLAVACAIPAFGLPGRQVFGLAAYPGLFALVFAFASAPEPLTGALFVAKAVTAALGAVTVMYTTPYPYVFGLAQRYLPTIVGDALLMTYRSLFLLAEKLSSLLVAVRLRSGLSARQPLRAARATTQALGGLLLYAFDLAQREYDVMRLRGYEERLQVTLPRSESRGFDAALVGVGGVMLAAALSWRVWFEHLNPYSWLLAVGAAALLALSWTLRRLRWK